MTPTSKQPTIRNYAKRITFLRRYLQLSILMVASLLCMEACSGNKDNDNTAGDFVALVNGKALTRAELDEIVPQNLMKKDSAELAKEFIYSWACDQLMFDQAKWDENSNQEIEQKVEQYRKQLIIHEYEKRLIKEQFSKSNAFDKIETYLSKLSDKPKAKERYAQGVLLIMPKSADHIAQIRRFAQLKKADDVENLEKYCHQIGIVYRLFNDHWLKVSQILPLFNEAGINADHLFKSKGVKELKTNDKIILLTLTELVQTGDILPEGLAEQAVKEEFERTEQIRYIKDYRKQLYDQAIEKRELIIRD